MNPRPLYRLLARSSPFGAPSGASLWLGDDHILHVRHHLTEDQYRRFYLRDIYWIRICQTNSSRILAIVLGAITALAALFLLASGGLISRALWGTITVIALFYFLMHLSAGRSCGCWIGTAVGEMRLRAPSRLRKAQRVLARLHPLIEEAQASLRTTPEFEEAEEAASAVTDQEPYPAPVTPALPSATPPPLPGRIATDERVIYAQAALTFLLMAFGLGKALFMLRSSMPLVIAGLFLAAVYTGGVVYLLIRQHQAPTGPDTVRYNWALLIAGFVVSTLIGIQSYILQFQQIGQDTVNTQALRLFARLSTSDSTWAQGLGWSTALVCITLAVVGLAVLSVQRKSVGWRT